MALAERTRQSLVPVAEAHGRPTTLRDRVNRQPDLEASWGDRLRGRSLSVPDGVGGTVNLRVTTMRRNLLGEKNPQTGLRRRERDLHLIGDYNDDLDYARISQAARAQLPENRTGQILPINVDRFATLSGSAALAEVVLNGDPDFVKNTVVYYNIAPRGADHGNGSLKNVDWKGEERQRLIFAISDTEVPILGVDSNYTFSMVRDRLTAAWEVDFTHDLKLKKRLNNESFRSLRVYPYGLALLRGRIGLPFFGREIDLPNEIPAPPAPIYDADNQALTAHILRVDGRQSRRGYGNQKLLLQEHEIPEEMKRQAWLLGTIDTNGKPITQLFVNTFAPDAKKLATADFFLGRGSSGDAYDLSTHQLEANRFFYPAADAFGMQGVTDKSTITFTPVAEGMLDFWKARDKTARQNLH